MDLSSKSPFHCQSKDGYQLCEVNKVQLTIKIKFKPRIKLNNSQGLSQDLITGGQFVPLAKILGDIFIFRGTDICSPFLLSRASDRSRTKKSNFAGFLGTNLQKNRPISQEFSGQTSPKSSRNEPMAKPLT